MILLVNQHHTAVHGLGSTAGFCMYGFVHDWDGSTGRTTGITSVVLKIPVIYMHVKQLILYIEIDITNVQTDIWLR